MSEVIDLLKKSGYSDKAIEYYTNKVNVGEMKDHNTQYERAAIPKRTDYKPQPELIWAPVEERLNFEPFEKGFTLEEAKVPLLRPV